MVTHIIDPVMIYKRDENVEMAEASAIIKTRDIILPNEQNPPVYRVDISVEGNVTQIIKGIYEFGKQYKLVPSKKVEMQPQFKLARRIKRSDKEKASSADKGIREPSTKDKEAAGPSKVGGTHIMTKDKQTSSKTRIRRVSAIKAATS